MLMQDAVLEFPRQRHVDLQSLFMAGLWLLGGLALATKDGATWILLGLILGVINAWRFGRSVVESCDPIALGPEGMKVPLAFGRMAQLTWEDVELVMLQVGRTGQRVLLTTAGRTLVFDSERFTSPETPQRIFQAAQARILMLPDGHERMARMRRGLEDTRAIAKRPAPATLVMLGVLSAIYVVQIALGNTQTVTGMLGANLPQLVVDGEWWRLVSANFLHGSIPHLGLNGFALWILGGQLERLLGTRRLVGIYLFSAVGGAAASMLLARPMFSVGASTAVFGLLGAMGVLHLRRSELPLGFRQPWRWWALILGINAALPLVFPVVDWMAHVGGMAAGAVATWALMAGRPLRPGADRRAMGLLAVTTAVTVVGLGMATRNALRGPEHTLQRVDAALPPASEFRNAFAWSAVIDPSSDTRTLHAASAIIEVAVKAAPDRADLRDTYATARYRVGDYAAAITHQRRAFEDLEDLPGPTGRVAWLVQLFDPTGELERRGRERAFATQLGRFYRASDRPPIPDVLTLEDGAPKPATTPRGDKVVFALVLDDGDLAGLVRARITEGKGGFAPHDFLRLPSDAALRVVEVLPAGDTDQPEHTWTWWKADPETMRYP